MIVRNRNAMRDFELLDKVEAGIILSGSEAKSAKTQGAKLDGAYVKLIGSEVQLINAHIPQYAYSREEGYEPTRTRTLLLSKREILNLKNKMAQNGNLTIVPVSLYISKRGIVKVEIALARGRKNWQKKTVEKSRSEKRRVDKEIKEFVKS